MTINYRVLLIDDNLLSNSRIKAQLSRLNYSVVQASTVSSEMETTAVNCQLALVNLAAGPWMVQLLSGLCERCFPNCTSWVIVGTGRLKYDVLLVKQALTKY